MDWRRVWITAAEDDAAAKRALRLAKSLRRTITRKKILVVTGKSVSTYARVSLQKEFDAVLPLDLNAGMEEIANGNDYELDFEEKVKIAVHGIQLFEKAVFVSSSIIVLQNVDFIFENLFGGSTVTTGETGRKKSSQEMTLACPVFAVIPSESHFSYMKNSFALKQPNISCPDFEALQSKAARLFESYGQFISPHIIPACEEKINQVRLVMIPHGTPERLTGNDRLLSNWGEMGSLIKEILEDGTLQTEKLDTDTVALNNVPLERMEEEPIAIVGMACRVPGSDNVEELWDFIINKGDAIRDAPEERWLWLEEKANSTTGNNKKKREELENVRAGFLKCPVDEFDAKFFGMSPKEMEFTDPQQRLLLEVSWEALEDAAIDATSLSGTPTGIFTGTWTRDYADMMNKMAFEEGEFFRSYMGNSYGATAGRMAHFYGVTGENIATESGCSSSIVAVGLAVNSLRRGNTSMALACGVNLMLQPFANHAMDAILSKDGRCKTFEASADGYGRAEGCGVVVLKRLGDAVRDGDNIRAVIRGYGQAQEGPSKSLGTPTLAMEKLAMTLALRNAEVLPWEVSFVEAHGTGTPVGDPMEMEAIAQVYGEGRREPLVVTSVKTNLGHMESASGIIGVIKTVLALEREILLPHRKLSELNPRIDLSSIPAVIPLEAMSWPKDSSRKRIAGVSSFGITGTDAHVILEETPMVRPKKNLLEGPTLPFQIMTVSARSEVALEELLKKYADKLKHGSCKWNDIAFTVNTGRAHFKEFRAAIIAKDATDFQRQVERKSVKIARCTSISEKQRVVFLFTGQGSQYTGMAKGLYEASIQFRRLFDKCDRIFRKEYQIDIKHALWDSNDTELLHQTMYSQTAIFVVELCLAELWKSWGVTPDVVLGHSLGEYAAATVAGILSLEDSLRLVAERSRLVDSLPQGKMIVINTDYEETCRLLKSIGNTVSLDIAAMNSHEQTTLAGTENDVTIFKKFCENNGIKSRVLDATHAFHSRMMDVALPQLRKLAEYVNYGTPTYTYISGLEGREVTSFDAEYWVRHTREPVNFLKACEYLRKVDGILVGVEVGPQPVLSSFVARNLEEMQPSPLLFPSLRRFKGDWETILDSVGRLYTSGVEVDWRGFHEGTGGGRKISGLPTYPFHRKRFWFKKPKSNDDGLVLDQPHPLVQFRMTSATPTRIFHSRLSLSTLPYVSHHVIGTHVIFPAAGYLEMLLAAGHIATLAESEEFRFPRQPVFLRDFAIDAPLKMTLQNDVQLQMVVAPAEDTNWNAVSIHRRTEDAAGSKSWSRHSNAKFSFFSNDSFTLEVPDKIDVTQLIECLVIEPIDDFYKKLLEVGLNFGEAFRSVKRFWQGNDIAMAELTCPNVAEEYFVHPVAIDGMIQVLMMAKCDGTEFSHLMVPVKIDQFIWFSVTSPATPITSFFVHVNKSSATVGLFDTNGKKLAAMSGVALVPTTVVAIDASLEAQKLILPSMFEEEWLPMKSSRYFTNHSQSSLFPVEILNPSASLPERDVLIEIVNNQTPVSAKEKKERELTYELTMLQLLQGFLKMGWSPRINEKVDVHQFIVKFNILEKNLLVTRRFFEIISSSSSFLTKLDDFDFLVSSEIPPIGALQERIEEIENLVESIKVEKECIRSVASVISEVLLGKDSVLPILFGEDRVAEKTYTEFRSAVECNKLLTQSICALLNEHYVKTAGNDSRAVLRILEIGGGTGGSTRMILPALQETGVEFSYTFTDISAGFFSSAEASYSDWKDRMDFRLLDIEKDPKTQGFIPEDFDVIVATHVLHATRNYTETMRNVRHLMKPNGIVFIVECFEPQTFLDAIFGLVEGYWRFEDVEQRPLHCILPEQRWPTLLASVGFNHEGIRLLKVPSGNGGVVVAQASSRTFKYCVPKIHVASKWVVVGGLYDKKAVVEVVERLKWQGRRVIFLDQANDNLQLPEAEIESGNVEGVLFLSDGKQTDLDEPTKRFLHLIQSLMSFRMAVAPKIVVVTRGAVTVGDQGEGYPHGGILWGMSRSLRSEGSTFQVLNVDLDPHETEEDNIIILLRLLWSWNTHKAEFLAIRDKQIFMAKLKRWKVTNKSLALPQNAPRFGLIFPTSNAISDLTFSSAQRRTVGANEVEIQLRAAALNFRDLFSVIKPTKEFEKDPAVGTDMAGVVTSVGTEVKTGVKVGDAVVGCFFDFGGLPSHVVVPAIRVAKLPSNLTFEDGSTLPAVFSTAYYSLIDIAKIKEGETILIHTASGGVGIAAIQLAKDAGAKIIATAGSRRKRNYLKEVWGIENVFHSRDLTYKKEILEVTGGRGVDVVLNSLTGPGFKEATLDVCVKGGRFIEMSKLNVWSTEDVQHRRPDVVYQIVDLTSVSDETKIHLMNKLEYLLHRGDLSPLPYEVFESVDIREALTLLQKARHIGKIVCKMPEPHDISRGSGNGSELHHLLFNERSTYLITGGLGGIGLEAAKWMASEGAKFIVLCGRRPPNEKAIQVISELNASGKVVTSVQLDVGEFEDCRLLIQKINSGEFSSETGEIFPPLRGIQHAAGCLSDATFPNQTWEKYEETFNGKVRGAWNIHQITLSTSTTFPLEHFVMYSSIAGVLGAMGQSNHAAANAFLDSLAHFRNARGLPATSINWGQWRQVGLAADLEINFLNPFTPLQGFASLKEILRNHKPQSIVVEAEFSKFKIFFPWMNRGGYANTALASVLGSSSGEQRSVSSYTLSTEKFWEEIDGAKGNLNETERILQRTLAYIIRQILKLEDDEAVDVDGNLQEMGLDSLMMVELKNILQTTVGTKVKLTADAFTEANTVGKLATRLRQLILEEKD